MQDMVINAHLAGLGVAELRDFLFQGLATSPSSPAQGRHFISTADGILRYYTGTAWRECREGTVRSVGIVQPAAGIQVSGGPITDTGSFTLTLSDDLAALEALGSTGFAVRTGANTWAQRKVKGTANQVNVANEDGVAGDVTLSLPQNIDTAANVTFSTLTLSGNPVNGNHAVTKAWVESLIQGMRWKDPVVTVATANIALTGLTTVNGRALAAGDRVGVVAQSAPADNGLYAAASGAWTRVPDADLFDEISGCAFMVLDGTSKGARFTCSAAKGGTLGTTALPFVQIDGGSNLGPGSGLILNGNLIDLNVDNTTIEVSGNVVRLKAGGLVLSHFAASMIDPAAGTAGLRTLGSGANQASPGNHTHSDLAKKSTSQAFGNGSAKSFTIAHPFSSLNVSGVVRLTNSPFTTVMCDVRPSDVDNVVVEVLKAPANNEYTITIRP